MAIHATFIVINEIQQVNKIFTDSGKCAQIEIKWQYRDNKFPVFIGIL